MISAYHRPSATLRPEPKNKPYEGYQVGYNYDPYNSNAAPGQSKRLQVARAGILAAAGLIALLLPVGISALAYQGEPEPESAPPELSAEPPAQTPPPDTEPEPEPTIEQRPTEPESAPPVAQTKLLPEFAGHPDAAALEQDIQALEQDIQAFIDRYTPELRRYEQIELPSTCADLHLHLGSLPDGWPEAIDEIEERISTIKERIRHIAIDKAMASYLKNNAHGQIEFAGWDRIKEMRKTIAAVQPHYVVEFVQTAHFCADKPPDTPLWPAEPEPETAPPQFDPDSVVLPDNWNDLSPVEKGELNPYGCRNIARVRADNGRCI